jgi:hypothetical protein
LVLVRSKLELLRSILVLVLARSKLVLELELGSKRVLGLARSKLELLRSKLVLARSKRSLPCGNRTNRLRWLVRR